MEPARRRVDGAAGGRNAPELNRATLMRCRAQDPMAFQVFIARYERLVFAVLSQMLGHGLHVEDLAQEAFLRAFVAFPRFDVDSAPPSRWLLTIATRLALNERKRAAPKAYPHGELIEHVTPEIETARHELGRAIEAALLKLSDAQRAVFVLAELHDLTLAEIAAALAVPENTVKTRLFRARERLRECLAPLRRTGSNGPL